MSKKKANNPDLKKDTVTIGDLEWHWTGDDDHLIGGGHETFLLQIVSGILKSQDHPVLLDVGAHVGLYTLNMAKYCETVYAIEANPKTYETLMENIGRNANVHPETTIKALNIAAWNETAVLHLFDPNDMERGGSTRTLREGEGLPVPAMALDPLFDKIDSPITFVKIDVEGAEANVLEGLAATVARDRPVLFIEMHDKYLNKPSIRDAVDDFLDTHGYEPNYDMTFGAAYYGLCYPEESAPRAYADSE